MPRRSRAPDALREYRAKRDFARTPEPAGKVAPPRGRRRDALRFSMQKHLASRLHYDLRLEHHGVLLSFAVPKGPSFNPKDKRLAVKTEDHPLEYLEFEGVIPEGYGAGIVLLWDLGTWRPQVNDVNAAIEKGDFKFTLDGVKLKGSWVLVRTRGYAGSQSSWLLIKHRDAFAGDLDVTAVAPLSVKTDRDFPKIVADEDPKVIQSLRAYAAKPVRAIIDAALGTQPAAKPKRRRSAAQN